jgi:hypothetical protein
MNYSDFIFIDDKGQEYRTGTFEVVEQFLATKFIKKDDNVLELGCRSGTNSCLISMLCNKLVAIDPCKPAIDACKYNMEKYGFNFICEWCTVSKTSQTLIENEDGNTFASYTEEGVSDIPHYTMTELENKYDIKFNALVADCEGCLETFINDNDITNINKIIYEQDNQCKCNYQYVESILSSRGFKLVENVYFDGLYRKVWII